MRLHRALVGLLACSGCEELADGNFIAQIYVEDVSPSRIPTTGGVEVSLSGRNFQPDTVVTIDGIQIDALIRNDESISFVAPSASPGAKSLQVRNREGAEATELLRYAAIDLWFGRRGPAYAAQGIDLRAMDLDRDGRDDALLLLEDGSIDVVANLGGDRFQRIDRLTDARFVDTEDVDGDGFPDLVEERGIRFGDGRGFGPLSAMGLVDAGEAIHRLAVGDFDGDHVRDIAYFVGEPPAGSSFAQGSMVIGRADNGPRGRFDRIDIALFGVYDPMFATDLDGDGADDLMFIDDAGFILVLFSPLIDPAVTAVSDFSILLPPTEFALSDVDGDGVLDVLFEGIDATGLRESFVARGTGARSPPFERPTLVTRFCGGLRRAERLIEWKRDTSFDEFGEPNPNQPFLLAVCAGELRVEVPIIGAAEGTVPRLESVDRLSFDDVYQVESAELDGRGGRDLLALTPDGLSPYYGGRAHQFSAELTPHPTICATRRCGGASGTSVAFGRFGAHRIAVVEEGRFALYGDVAEIGSALPVMDPIPGSEGASLFTILAGDLDGDDDDDLIAAYRVPDSSYRVTMLMNEVDGFVALPPFDPTSVLPPRDRDIALAPFPHLWDLDGDGSTELVWSNRIDAVRWVPSGTSAAGRALGIDVVLSNAKTIDIDGDGDLDVYDAAEPARALELFIQDGDRFLGRKIELGIVPNDVLILPREDGFDLFAVGKADENFVLDRYRLDAEATTAELVERRATRPYLFALRQAEIDGDGLADLALVPNDGFDLADPIELTKGRMAVLYGAELEEGELHDHEFLRGSELGANPINWRDVRFHDVDLDGLDDLIFRTDLHGFETVILKNQSR